MTRTASNLNKAMVARRIVEPEQLWWFREVTNLPNDEIVYFTGDLIATGSIIKRVAIETGIEPGGAPEQLQVLLFLTANESFTIAEAVLEEQIIWWTSRDRITGFYPMCDDCHHQWPMSKRVVGSNIRIGLIIANLSNKVASARVGVLIQQP
ncbi:hypothetical protein ES703_21049 [subsurface metagenome]